VSESTETQAMQETDGTQETAVTVERRGHVLLMGLNRPQKRNAFNLAMIDQLAVAYHELEEDEELRCGVLFAHGDHFTGGLDLAEVGPVIQEGRLEMSGDGRRDPWRKDGIWRTPIVAAVQGWVMTLAIELLLAADIRVAAENARFAQMEINRGIYAFGGATVRLPRDATGRQIDRAVELAEAIATRSAPLGVRTTLESAHRARREGEDAAFARLEPDMVALFQSEDGREGLMSFIERREARFTGR
jgi:enoyl-CoA hydratase